MSVRIYERNSKHNLHLQAICAVKHKGKEYTSQLCTKTSA
jgi:hypothetical protein